MTVTTKCRFLSKRNFTGKLNLSYIVLLFVEEGRLQTEITWKPCRGLFET